MDQISICESLLKRSKIKLFLKRLIMADEKWITTIMYEKDRSRSKMKLCKRWQSQDDTKKSDAVMCGGIGKESFTTNCRPVKLILISTVNNWKDYAKQSRK